MKNHCGLPYTKAFKQGRSRIQVVETYHELRREVHLHFGYQFNLAQGFAALQSKSHIEGSGGSKKLQMQPFSAVACVLGLVGSPEITLQVFADLHLNLFWSE